jgi:hypothetical protein
MGKANMAYRFVSRKKTNENKSARANTDANVPSKHLLNVVIEKKEGRGT